MMAKLSLIAAGFFLAGLAFPMAPMVRPSQAQEAASATPPLATPTIAATPAPTLAPPAPPASFYGQVCVDADCRRGGGEVVATIGNVQCGHAQSQLLADGGPYPSFHMYVASAGVVPGCGVEGAAVHFSLDGRSARPAGIWHAGQDQYLLLTIGDDFAGFSGGLFANGEPWLFYQNADGTWSSPPIPIKAFIGPTLCGQGWSGPGFADFPQRAWYSLLSVLPASLREGCGRPGDTITFTVDDRPATETAVWSPGFHDLDLSVGLQLPDGGGPPEARTNHTALLLSGLLALLALLLIGGGTLLLSRPRLPIQ